MLATVLMETKPMEVEVDLDMTILDHMVALLLMEVFPFC